MENLQFIAQEQDTYLGMMIMVKCIWSDDVTIAKKQLELSSHLMTSLYNTRKGSQDGTSQPTWILDKDS